MKSLLKVIGCCSGGTVLCCSTIAAIQFWKEHR